MGSAARNSDLADQKSGWLAIVVVLHSLANRFQDSNQSAPSINLG